MFNNFLMHVLNHNLKDLFMLNKLKCCSYGAELARVGGLAHPQCALGYQPLPPLSCQAPPGIYKLSKPPFLGNSPYILVFRKPLT